jgi:hypothetical protein
MALRSLHFDPNDVAAIAIVRLDKFLEDGIADRMEKTVQLRGVTDGWF